MNRHLKPSEAIFTAAIARRYYLQDIPKKEIAEEFGISRFKVARILRRARELGIVDIRVHLPGIIDAELSDRLQQAFDLRRAIVITSSSATAEILREQLGEIGAALLEEVLVEDDILGIGWGRTLTAMTKHLKTLPRCSVVQLTGAIGSSGVVESSIEMARRVGEVTGGPVYPIYAPLIVDTPEAAQAIRRQSDTTRTFGMFGRLTKAVVAIGSWSPPDSQLYSAIGAAERALLRSLGVRAEICSTLVGDDGRPIEADLTERSIAISGDQIRQIPEVIALAGGRTKASAIRAVLVGGYVSSLVTDTEAATALLAETPG